MRVCPYCKNDGSAGRITAVLNDIHRRGYLEIYIGGCHCGACGAKWIEHADNAGNIEVEAWHDDTGADGDHPAAGDTGHPDTDGDHR